MSPLAHLQAEIGARLLSGDGRIGSKAGTPAQRAGWPVTLALYRQWRMSRIRALAPLTLARLAGYADLFVDAFIATNPASAADFLPFAAAARPEDPYLAEITFLEQALLLARRPASAEGPPSHGYLRRSSRASLRTVPFPPDRLMSWLSGRGHRPLETPGGVRVLVAPGVNGWVRAATVAEADVWHWLAMDRPVMSATGEWTEPVRTLRSSRAVLAGTQAAVAATPSRFRTSEA